MTCTVGLSELKLKCINKFDEAIKEVLNWCSSIFHNASFLLLMT